MEVGRHRAVIVGIMLVGMSRQITVMARVGSNENSDSRKGVVPATAVA
jgi:hypothetical protein